MTAVTLAYFWSSSFVQSFLLILDPCFWMMEWAGYLKFSVKDAMVY
ncbi:MAG: hypothetical protein ACQXXH_00275 [Candidatus Bathyarchaeia archaeon]|nr:hypothetical protein [Candidatus Bathyarchaeota archaeon A05DMB-4]MDH7595496.1 hypothetical protein [Candidatus Bathyarchaeota archaeon]